MAKKKVGMVDSVREIWKELFERSVWPSRDEVFLKTIVVIVLLAIVSVILGVVDYVITFLTSILLKGDFVAVLFSSRVTLFVALLIVFLCAVFFAIRYVRKNRYNK